MLIVTTDHIPGNDFTPLGLATGACCLSKSLVGDIKANVKNWTTGGELNDYSRMLESATAIVVERLISGAKELNADAVIGFRLVTCSVAEGAAELIAYGTAVRLKNKESKR